MSRLFHDDGSVMDWKQGGSRVLALHTHWSCYSQESSCKKKNNTELNEREREGKLRMRLAVKKKAPKIPNADFWPHRAGGLG